MYSITITLLDTSPERGVRGEEERKERGWKEERMRRDEEGVGWG
jgi:hypothetical protein